MTSPSPATELANDVSLELIALKSNIKSASGCEFDAEAGTVLIPAGTRRVRVYLGQAVPVTGVELDKTELELTVNDTAKLTATVTPANADNAKVSWTSSDETVAIVDKNGNVTAVGAGTATVTVTTEDGGFTATCTVTVKAKAVPVDKSALEALYKELKDTANDGYTDETWERLPEGADRGQTDPRQRGRQARRGRRGSQGAAQCGRRTGEARGQARR